MFEKKIQESLFNPQTEKTYIDKVLARQDVEAIRALVKKPKLVREEVLEILYLLTSVESKLLNFSEWDRYVQLKFFVWIREHAKIFEQLYDYQDDLRRKTHTCASCHNIQKEHRESEKEEYCECKKFIPSIVLSKRTLQLLYNNERMIEHNTKFLVDLYLNIGRTSLSLGATGIMELLKQKYELAYPNLQLGTADSKGGFMNFFRK